MAKVSVPKGTRDFSPVEMARRNYIFDTIRSVYERHGYMPIETPAMERNDTLLGKYGEEGDRLIFRILNSGDFLSKADQDALNDGNSLRTANSITEKSLRYDLTVPFARYVVQHQNEITFPFKRYQIQPVWRADRPQKGRYREFYQCDADVIGSNSLLNELELVQIIDQVFTTLNIKVNIKINDRKILQGLAEAIGQPDKLIDLTVALDKLDKIGAEKVIAEWRDKGLKDQAISKLTPLLNAQDGLAAIEGIVGETEAGAQGLADIRSLFGMVEDAGLSSSEVSFEPTLARGLNYYTGAIFEVQTDEGSLRSSICGGGRYDDLTGIFGLPNMSGVGISFGADRIYDVLLELDRFPESTQAATKLLFVNFGETEAAECLKWLKAARLAGINAELYPDSAKMGKQMKYADSKKISWVAIMGSNEIENGVASLKNMTTGEQADVDLPTLINTIA